MITIFTIPKAFTDPHINIIQRNAIKSWILLGSECNVTLIGNDYGVHEVAAELKVNHIPKVECNEFGTPLLNSAFKLIKENSKNNYLCYINADIILSSNFFKSLNLLPRDNFLAVGRRHDLNIVSLIDYKNKLWEKKLLDKVKQEAKLHSAAGIDYFIFNRNSFNNLPAFAVGRVGWDNWMIFEARRKKMKTIDASSVITAIHQNHDYLGYNKGNLRKSNPEAINNIKFTKNNAYLFTIEDTNWKITKDSLTKKRFYWLPFLKRYIKKVIKI